MCQSKADGGKRCRPSITATERARLKKHLGTLDKNDPEYAETSTKIDELNKAAELYGSCVSPLEIPMPEGVKKILDDIHSKGYSPLLVGGTVRDALVGGTIPKDFDIEVYGVDIDTLASSMRASGYNVDEVGKAFGVLKVVTKDDAKDDIDISVPRTDSLAGAGHRGFEVEMNSNMSVEEASARRDFTFNAMMWDYRQNAMIDPHRGSEDLKKGVLRHVSEAFAEDPLRVLRGFQFAGRFGMTIDPDTAKFCQQLSPRSSELAKERIATEWEKFYLKSKHPSKAMKVLRQTGWNNHAPGLDKINTDDSNVDDQLDTAQKAAVDAKLKPEHRVGLQAAIIMRKMDDKEAWDFTKTTIIGDDNQKIPLTLRNMSFDNDDQDYAIRRVAQDASQKKVSIEDWARYETISGDKKKAESILNRAKELGVDKEAEKPFLMGRHLIPLTKQKPGKWMGEVIAEAEELQYRGKIRSEKDALAWAKERLSS